jgi:DNA-binding transcriptional MocR family regulator
MVTNGSLEAGAMLFQHLVGPSAPVLVEQPSYDRTLLLLERLGAERIGVPLEDDGIDTGELERVVSEGPPVKLVHVIPNFHNPAGCTLSAEKRRRLLTLAAEHGFWILEDDPYRELAFDEEPPPTMLSADGERVIHASSFSKTVSPGVRVGYLAGPADEIAQLAKRANEIYISPNMLAESIVYELCRSGALDENVEFVKGALRERRDTLVEALREHIAEAEFVVPGGGYFLWLTLPEDVTTVDVQAAALEEKVAFIAGPDFMLDGGHSSLRLSFASVPPDQIPEGVERIARALERVRAASPA